MNMFLACSINGNILFLSLKHLVSWEETKCFDVINVYETKSSFHRRYYLNGAKKRQKRLVVHEYFCVIRGTVIRGFRRFNGGMHMVLM
jgi:hypothetical protein